MPAAPHARDEHRVRDEYVRDEPVRDEPAADAEAPRAEAWRRLADLLGTSDAQAIVDRVATLADRLRTLDTANAPQKGFVTIGEVEGVVRRLHSKVQALQDQNAHLAAQVDAVRGGAGPEGAFAAMYARVAGVLDALDAATPHEAARQAARLRERLDELLAERETLMQAGFEDFDDALDQMVRMEAELEALRATQDATQDQAASPETHATPPEAAPAREAAPRDGTPPQEARTHEEARARTDADGPRTLSLSSDSHSSAILHRLGVWTLDEADELVALVRQMSDQLARLRDERDRVAAETGVADADDLLAMLSSMEDQLVLLYRERDLHRERDAGDPPSRDQAASANLPADAAAIVHLLGIGSLEEAERLAHFVRAMHTQVERLRAQQAHLMDVGLASVQDALAMIHSMEEQLVDLYGEREGRTRTAEAIQRLLGITTEDEARQLVRAVRNMSDQLARLRDERDHVARRMGVDDPNDLLALIQSMEEQLVDLYRQQEDRRSTREIAKLKPWNGQTDDIRALLGIDTVDEAHAMARAVRAMHDRLVHLHAEQQKLLEAGIRSPADALAMIQSMDEQLVELYSERESARRREQEPTDEAPAQAAPSGAALAEAQAMLASMEAQLQALYQAQQRLVDAGLTGPDEAVERIATLEDAIAAREAEADRLRDEVERLTRERDRLAQERDRVAEERDRAVAEASAPPRARPQNRPQPTDSPASRPPQTPRPPKDLPAVSGDTLADNAVLRQLDDLSPGDLDTLPFGAVCVDDRGTVQRANARGVRLPGFQGSARDARGRNFFIDVAPSANNSLFRGRFRRGVAQGSMNTGFLYTFVGPGHPPAVARVQMYRAPRGQATWILHRPI